MVTTSIPVAGAAKDKQASARLEVSRHACALFWERGVSATSGDDIAAAAGLSTRTIWRYFRSKESCVEPVLALSAQRFIELPAGGRRNCRSPSTWRSPTRSTR